MSTIKSPRDIQAIFAESTRAAHPLMVALIAPTPAGRGHEGRVVFVAGKRLGNAVVRNRAKRVMRETVRGAKLSWPGHDVALIARDRTGKASPEELGEALKCVLTRAKVLR